MWYNARVIDLSLDRLQKSKKRGGSLATYFISDIHGEYDLFCRLLEKIKYSSSDKLIILGDIIDKGSKSILTTKLVMSLSNCQMITGNHEYYFMKRFVSLASDMNDGDSTDELLFKLQEYFPNEREKLTFDIIEYFESLPYYIEERDYICVHAGLSLDSRGCVISMDKQIPQSFLFDRKLTEKSVQVNSSKAVLFGHTPCHYQNGNGDIILTKRAGDSFAETDIRAYGKIQLDTGAFYINKLGCIRLEDMREFYVTR